MMSLCRQNFLAWEILPSSVPRQPHIVIENCLKRAKLWPLFNIIPLKKNMHAAEDQEEFAQWLLEIGNGNMQCDVQDFSPDSTKMPSQCNVVENDNIIDVFTNLGDLKAIANTVILTPTNETSLHMNELFIQKLPGAPKG